MVGYTNAGKSTLFNSLTHAGAYAADQLFATLDPTLRRLDLQTEFDTVLIDTVGFIRHLPHSVVAAFRSTLEETQDATLLVHVIDVHDDHRHDRIDEVNEVLKEVGAEEIPQIEVYNKIDLVADAEPRIDRAQDGRPLRVWLSAKQNIGLDLLLQAITEYLQWQEAEARGEEKVFGELSHQHRYQLCLQASAGRLRAQLFEEGVVASERIGEHGEWLLEVDLWPRQLESVLKHSDCELLGEIEAQSVVNL